LPAFIALLASTGPVLALEPVKMLRYTNIEEAIRLARLAGMSTIEIVRVLSGAVPYSQALKIAKKAAPILGISVKEFIELRRNW